MNKDDTNKVVKLRQPPAKVAGVSVDEAIQPKSIVNMTDVEQELFLNQLRDRRLRAAQMLKEAQVARRQADSIATMMKLDRKIDATNKQLERATKALDKLEELVYGLRALTLQHTDIDITKVEQ